MNQSLEPKQISNEDTFEEKVSLTPLVEEGQSAVSEAQLEITEITTSPAEEETQVSADPQVEPETEEVKSGFEKLTKEQIVERLGSAIEFQESEISKAEVDILKHAFYKLQRVEIENARKEFIAAGGDEKDFVSAVDELEESLKEKLLIYREKRASAVAENEKQKEVNLEAKKAIIAELKSLIESTDDFYKTYNEFRRLQQQWKEIKAVPQAAVNDLWKEYQLYSEKFYDLLKINNEMRDYDFKKNLEHKLLLCEAVERLDEEKDVISAFHQLQKLHQEWREIGPVSKNLREEIWTRFKNASTAINKKHQDHFEILRSSEQHNLEEKTAICEEMESIDYATLLTFKDWDDKNKRVLELQTKWKTIGFAPKKSNIKIFERFRATCDVFFQKKSEFYKGVKENMDHNYELKKVLCEKAEALKDSQEWKETTDKMIAMQKEWKSIGSVSRKNSDAIWKRFITACDYFFEQKNVHFSSQKSEEVENLKLKKEVIEKINTIDPALNSGEAMTLIRELMNEWNGIGFVPFREKDKLYKEYREAVDKQFDRLKVNESERRLQSFKSNLTELGGGDDRSKNKLLSERERMLRTYERLKSEIQTYENNIGFLSVSSKGGGGLVKEMTRKIENLKEELDLILKKIGAIDDNLGFGKS